MNIIKFLIQTQIDFCLGLGLYPDPKPKFFLVLMSGSYHNLDTKNTENSLVILGILLK